MLYLELFCKYNTLIRILDYSAMKKSLSFVRHCENCERRGGHDSSRKNTISKRPHIMTELCSP